MSGVDKFKARLGANISESMGGSAGGAGGPLPSLAHGAPSRYDGVTRPKDVLTVPVAKLVPDSEQPRTEFDENELQRLAESLRTRGQLQPIRVRWDAVRELWVIVSGERRWRAAALAGVVALACVEVKGVLTPESILEDQLVENCLRSDLKPVEEARAFRALMERRGYSARQLAESLALSHTAVNRALALLDLPADVQAHVEHGVLAPSAAAEVAKLTDPALQSEVAEAAVAGGLNRSEITELVQAVRAKRPAPTARPEPITVDVGGVIVSLRWRKGGENVTAAQALRKALKAIVEAEKDRAEQAA
jgi:ParB family transcriptional regulator, chromosome partitioning protein